MRHDSVFRALLVSVTGDTACPPSGAEARRLCVRGPRRASVREGATEPTPGSKRFYEAHGYLDCDGSGNLEPEDPGPSLPGRHPLDTALCPTSPQSRDARHGSRGATRPRSTCPPSRDSANGPREESGRREAAWQDRGPPAFRVGRAEGPFPPPDASHARPQQLSHYPAARPGLLCATGELQQLDGVLVVFSDGHMRCAQSPSTSARARDNSSGSPSHHSASDAIASSARSGSPWTYSARYSANDATTRACRRASNGSTASAQWTPVGVCVDILRPLFRACPILPGWALRKRLVRAAAVEKALVAGDLEPSGSRDFSGDRAYRIGRKFRKRRGARRQVISARSCVGKQFGTHADHRDRNAR
jgi:hypothetical protein